MIRFTRAELEAFLAEDTPYYDLTTNVLTQFDPSLRQKEVQISYLTRQDGVVCGTEEVAGLFDVLGITKTSMIASGTQITPGQLLISGAGPASEVFVAWKVGQNLLERASGVATKAYQWTSAISQAGIDCPVLVTRKVLPGTKKLMTKACISGGAVPHRLGTSETILVFAQHLDLVGGIEVFQKQIDSIRARNPEKMLLVECKNTAATRNLLNAGVDGVQFDKIAAGELKDIVPELRREFPNKVLLAAGGIKHDNFLDYAKTGVSGIVTSSLYDAKPLDVEVQITS